MRRKLLIIGIVLLGICVLGFWMFGPGMCSESTVAASGTSPHQARVHKTNCGATTRGRTEVEIRASSNADGGWSTVFRASGLYSVSADWEGGPVLRISKPPLLQEDRIHYAATSWQDVRIIYASNSDQKAQKPKVPSP